MTEWDVNTDVLQNEMWTLMCDRMRDVNTDAIIVMARQLHAVLTSAHLNYNCKSLL